MTYTDMTPTINLFLKKLVKALGLTNEQTAVEKLEQFIQEQKHQTLLERIKAIRTNTDYEPDYNKPRVYTDIIILRENNTPISSNTKLACERPIDLGSDIKAWKKIVSIDHKKELKAKQLRQLQNDQRKEFFDTEVTNYVMNKMLKLN